MRKPAFCLCKNKSPDQLHGSCAADHSLPEIFWDVAGQLSASLKIFVGQKMKMPDKLYRGLLCSNIGLFISSTNCKFDGNMCNLHPI